MLLQSSNFPSVSSAYGTTEQVPENRLYVKNYEAFSY